MVQFLDLEPLSPSPPSRRLGYWSNFNWTARDTDNNGSYSSDGFDESNLVKAEDVSVDAIVTSIFINGVICLVLMVFYECLRRRMPTVYSSRKKLRFTGSLQENFIDEPESTEEGEEEEHAHPHVEANLSLPEIDRPFDWMGPVFGVPWQKVRETAGLDGYFFLRYIRMNVRIAAVSCFWFSIVLVPLYLSGNQEHVYGWYKCSAMNLPNRGWKLWVPCVFFYTFTAFIFFVIKQEYRHFLEVRQDFLARGTLHIDPQHHYSIKVENIPYELRSDRALAEYFDSLFPNKVHSASVVLKLPDLELASRRCMRVCRRLEKSIAYLHATGERPTHIVGRGRATVLGVDLAPCDCKPAHDCASADHDFYEEMTEKPPPRGSRADSIFYYTQLLASYSKHLFELQQQKRNIAESGNVSIRATNWFKTAVIEANVLVDQILEDSAADNDLRLTDQKRKVTIPQAECMASQYGSISPFHDDMFYGVSYAGDEAAFFEEAALEDPLAVIAEAREERQSREENEYVTPFARDQYSSTIRRIAGRLGLDFVVSVLKILNKQLDVTLENALASTMSSTGYVTFLDLATVTCAASAPLSAKSTVMHVSVAPEPREVIWENAHVPKIIQERREQIVNAVFVLGAILWSFPLAFIQAFAKAENIAQIPGMEWILTFHGGTFTKFVNGYMPVVALLVLILILPVIFEFVALKYERRKTLSEIQSSMIGRYFYYQLANIYISVTAGSILRSLGDILNQPSAIFELLGRSLPTMVGYFVALLVTKILAGLPMIFLRFGALSRLLFLRFITNQKKLTQRELDAVYRLENVQYGWEFPTQFLVAVIVFTYAIICPVILPFGFLYFFGALMVYKKQVLYVYSPTYESGGAMFPVAVQKTLGGLVCAQVTFLGYIGVRGCLYQPIFMFPLPLLTIYGIGVLNKTYAEPSQRLSMERAREHDRFSSLKQKLIEKALSPKGGSTTSDDRSYIDYGVKARRKGFDKNSYRQPVLTKLPDEPWNYRRSQPHDPETEEVKAQLRQINRFQTAYEKAVSRQSENTASPPI